MSQNKESLGDFVSKRYENAIKYYWRVSKSNRRAYKTTRILAVILGASVTLIASLSSADFISEIPFWKILFAVTAPVLAAILTIVTGFGQSFHWGAAWRDMVINAERLEKERDRFFVTKQEERDIRKEVEILNDIVISETQTFFQRILGGAKKDKTPSKTNDVKKK